MIEFADTTADHRAAQWLRRPASNGKIVARNNSVPGLVHAVKEGIGVAPLPTAVGDAEEDLVRVLEPIPELGRIGRLLTTPELRRTPRVAVLFDFLIEEIDTLKPILTG